MLSAAKVDEIAHDVTGRTLPARSVERVDVETSPGSISP
jgi:hypothetical protein